MSMQPHKLADALVRPRSSRRRSTTFDTRVTWRDQEVALRFVGPETAQKRALLVHGWEADSSDLDVIATHLAQLGMRCVLPDLPAHGASEGDTLMIPEAAELIRQIDAAYGRFSVVIGHSIGSAVVLLKLIPLRSASPRKSMHYHQLTDQRCGRSPTSTAPGADSMGVEKRRMNLVRSVRKYSTSMRKL